MLEADMAAAESAGWYCCVTAWQADSAACAALVTWLAWGRACWALPPTRLMALSKAESLSWVTAVSAICTCSFAVQILITRLSHRVITLHQLKCVHLLAMLQTG